MTLSGYYPQITTIPGYDTAPFTISLKGYVKVKDKSIQIISDRRVLNSDRILEFHAEIGDNIDAELSWRIVNTGKHVIYLSQNSNNAFNPFRGILHAAHYLRKAYGKYNKVLAPTKLVTQEHTEYTGKHWIECVAIKGGICIAKSKPFFVNIYNEKYPYYD